jgi:hypothetical protein
VINWLLVSDQFEMDARKILFLPIKINVLDTYGIKITGKGKLMCPFSPQRWQISTFLSWPAGSTH